MTKLESAISNFFDAGKDLTLACVNLIGSKLTRSLETSTAEILYEQLRASQENARAMQTLVLRTIEASLDAREALLNRASEGWAHLHEGIENAISKLQDARPTPS